MLQEKTIKFILQPIIENSIEKGFKLLYNKRGLLEIKIQIHLNYIEFITSDNGYGMDTDTLKRLRSSITNDEIAESKHIGLLNVHQRICILYGQNYGCEILKFSEDGTVISIVIPMQ